VDRVAAQGDAHLVQPHDRVVLHGQVVPELNAEVGGAQAVGRAIGGVDVNDRHLSINAELQLAA
jgi:hypothetical protein